MDQEKEKKPADPAKPAASPAPTAAPVAKKPEPPTAEPIAPEIAKAAQLKRKAESLLKSGVVTRIGETASQVGSPDQPTRRMAWLFVLSVTGIVAVVGLAAVYARKPTATQMDGTQDEAKHLGEFLEKQAGDAKARAEYIDLGTFTIELTSKPDQKRSGGTMNLAELEIVLDCDTAQTRSLVEGNIEQIKNVLTNVFVPMDRENLMSREGKRKLKGSIADATNRWLEERNKNSKVDKPAGKISSVFFQKLIIN